MHPFRKNQTSTVIRSHKSDYGNMMAKCDPNMSIINEVNSIEQSSVGIDWMRDSKN